MYTEIYSERVADAWSPIEAEEIAATPAEGGGA